MGQADDDYRQWLRDRRYVAIKIASTDPPADLAKVCRVPDGAIGLARFGDGSVRRIGPGYQLSGHYDLLLVKPGELAVRWDFLDLKSRDGFPVTAEVILHFTQDLTKASDLQDFERSLFTFPRLFSLQDLRNIFQPDVKRIVATFVYGHEMVALHQRNRGPEVEKLLRDGLKRPLQGTALAFAGLQALTFQSDPYVEHISSGALPAVRNETGQKGLAAREDPAQKLRALLTPGGIPGLLDRCDDDRLRTPVYALLMKEGLLERGPEEAAKGLRALGDEVMQALQRAAAAANLPAGPSGEGPVDVPTDATRRILLTAGHRVLLLDPAKPAAAPEVVEFPEPLRTARIQETPTGTILLAGGRSAVYLAPFPGAAEIRAYPFPAEKPPRGGANAVTSADDHLFATHSEFGVVRWSVVEPDAPGGVFREEATLGNATTRAAQVGPDGKLYFATGPHAYAAELDGQGKIHLYDSGDVSPLSCLAVGRRHLFAGSESGALYAWPIGSTQPGLPLLRRRDAVTSLHLARLRGLLHVVYGTRDLGAHARMAGQNLETTFETGDVMVGLAAAASDWISATGQSGFRLLAWSPADPKKPALDIDLHPFTDRPVYDLVHWRGEPGV